MVKNCVLGLHRFREEGETAKKAREEGEGKQKNRKIGEPAEERGKRRIFFKKFDMNVQGLNSS